MGSVEHRHSLIVLSCEAFKLNRIHMFAVFLFVQQACLSCLAAFIPLYSFLRVFAILIICYALLSFWLKFKHKRLIKVSILPDNRAQL